jgi:hypothetical protein
MTNTVKTAKALSFQRRHDADGIPLTAATTNEQCFTEQELLDAGMSTQDIEKALTGRVLRKSEKDGVVTYTQTYLSRMLVGDGT